MKAPLLLFAAAVLSLQTTFAQHGMPAEARETIHGLFDAHEKIQREVSETDEGYVAKTTSSDAEVAKLLQNHVAQMRSRLEEGLMVRRWDPAFREFVDHYDDMEIAIESIDHGLQVTVTGKTDAAKLVARNHAGIISRFVSEGWKEHDETHAAVLTQEDSSEKAPAKECCLAGKEGGSCGNKAKGCQNCRSSQ